MVDHLATLERETNALLAAARRAPIDAPVPACPGWDVGRLCGHLGRVQLWTAEVARTRESVDARTVPKAERGDEISYLEGSLAVLLDALRALPPDAPCWNFTARDLTGRFWHRRQAHEAVVHRRDVEAVTGVPASIEPELASDGIDEALMGLVAGRLPDGARLDGSLHVHCTDVAGEWTVADTEAGISITREHAKGTAALRGPAEQLLLVLWRRAAPATADGLEIFGDHAVLDRWLALGVPG